MNKTVIFLTNKHFNFCQFTKIQIHNQLKDVRKRKKMMMLTCKEQEAHGPHRSPEKTVQINKRI